MENDEYISVRKLSEIIGYKIQSIYNMIHKNTFILNIYMDERVREHAGLPWNQKNAKYVRSQLDKIHIAIESGSFKFAEIFPKSKKVVCFSEKECQFSGEELQPDKVRINDYIWTWYELLKASDRVTERTFHSYKSQISNYLVPFFGELMFSDINKSTCDKFVSWAKKRKLRKKAIGNKTVNKILVPMKMICSDAAIEYGWGTSYSPFFWFQEAARGWMIHMKNYFHFQLQTRL